MKANERTLKFYVGGKYGSPVVEADNPTVADVERGLSAIQMDKQVTLLEIRVETGRVFPSYVEISVEVQPKGEDERATILYLYQANATTFENLYMVTSDGSNEELFFDDNNALDPVTMRKSVSLDVAKFAIRHFYEFQKPLPDAVLEYL